MKNSAIDTFSSLEEYYQTALARELHLPIESFTINLSQAMDTNRHQTKTWNEFDNKDGETLWQRHSQLRDDLDASASFKELIQSAERCLKIGGSCILSNKFLKDSANMMADLTELGFTREETASLANDNALKLYRLNSADTEKQTSPQRRTQGITMHMPDGMYTLHHERKRQSVGR